MVNIVVAILLLALLGTAAGYLIRQKKKGVTCPGCPHAKQCGGNCCSKDDR